MCVVKSTSLPSTSYDKPIPFKSISSDNLGLCFIPIISSSFVETIIERPGLAAFMALADTFLIFFACTPFLLHFLTKRFVENIYYNPKTKIFTTVHYNFILRKKALRFTADEVIDAASEVEKNKFSLQFATCSVRSYPILLLLEEDFYTDQEVFKLLTKNFKSLDLIRSK
uniref:YcxB domain-containing protein n=1 Tax=Meloidogyne hapla TaxID=6305 RepID=A0A1I8BMC9_MELHA